MIFRVGISLLPHDVLFNNDSLRVAPKVLFALEQTNKPRREEAAGNAPCPRLLFVVVGGHDAASGDESQHADGGVDDDV